MPEKIFMLEFSWGLLGLNVKIFENFVFMLYVDFELPARKHVSGHIMELRQKVFPKPEM